MKIAVFHNLPFGGAKRVLFEEVKALSRNHKLVLFKLSGQKKDIFDIESFVDETYVFKFKSKNNFPLIFNRLYSDYKKIIYLRSIHKKIAKIIDASNFDVVLIHPDFNTQAPYILKYLKTKNIYYCHELLRIAYEDELRLKDEVSFLNRVYENGIRKIYKYIDLNNAKSADKILVNSLYIKNKVKNIYGRNSTVCYPGVNFNFFIPLPKVKKKNILLAGGEVINNLNSVQIKSMLGKNLKDRYLIKTIAKSKEKKYISDNQMKKEYNNALLTICLSVNEPFGMIPLESLSCGTPVIALNKGGYKETVENNKSGFLIENVNSLNRLFQSISLASLKKMSKFGRKDMVARFSWQKHILILEKALSSI